MLNYKNFKDLINVSKFQFKSWTNDEGTVFATAICWEQKTTCTMPLELYKSILANPNTEFAVKSGDREINGTNFTTSFLFIPKVDIKDDVDYLGEM